MKIRLDAVAVSGILFTLALLTLAPHMKNYALMTREDRLRDISAYPVPGIAEDQVAIPNWPAPLGFASLTIIAIGLVVTWTGYIRGIRWTYFVMFVIVWLWAFPVRIIPLILQGYPFWRDVAQGVARSGWVPLIKRAITMNGLERAMLEPVVTFPLMVLALILPAKTFILGPRGGPGRPGRTGLGAPDERTLPEI